MKRSLFINALFGLASVSVSAQQPPPLQLNVPYSCPGNTIVVVKHCENRNGTEVCSLVKGAPNGPLGNEISMPKAQAAAIGLMCSTSGSAVQPKAAASSDYTNDLPSVERVKAEIKGSDPTDTLARQVAVFTYLESYIDRIKYNRTVRGEYTPGEQKMMGAYRMAAYQMSQDYAKTHTAAEAQAFERLHGQYEMNSAFYKDWSTRLIGPQSAAAYKEQRPAWLPPDKSTMSRKWPNINATVQRSRQPTDKYWHSGTLRRSDRCRYAPLPGTRRRSRRLRGQGPGCRLYGPDRLWCRSAGIHSRDRVEPV